MQPSVVFKSLCSRPETFVNYRVELTIHWLLSNCLLKLWSFSESDPEKFFGYDCLDIVQRHFLSGNFLRWFSGWVFMILMRKSLWIIGEMAISFMWIIKSLSNDVKIILSVQILHLPKTGNVFKKISSEKSIINQKKLNFLSGSKRSQPTKTIQSSISALIPIRCSSARIEREKSNH